MSRRVVQRLSPKFVHPNMLICPLSKSIGHWGQRRNKQDPSPNLSAFATSWWCQVTRKFSSQHLWAQETTKVGILDNSWDRNFGNPFLLMEACWNNQRLQKINGKSCMLRTEGMWVWGTGRSSLEGQGKGREHVLKTDIQNSRRLQTSTEQ